MVVFVFFFGFFWGIGMQLNERPVYHQEVYNQVGRVGNGSSSGIIKDSSDSEVGEWGNGRWEERIV
jgi:hypothetical protein